MESGVPTFISTTGDLLTQSVVVHVGTPTFKVTTSTDTS